MTPRSRVDRDYYATLGVSPTATDDEVRHAYRRLALRWHPDRNAGDVAAGERFKEISEAYAVLIDARKRADYDRARALGARAEWRPNRDELFRDLFADPRASAIFEELTRELSRVGVRVERRDFRETLFGGRAVVSGSIVVVGPLTSVTTLFRLARGVARALRAPTARDASRSRAPERGFGQRLRHAARWMLGVPSTTPADDALDVVVPLRLEPREAVDGCRKRVALGDGEDVLVTIPAGVQSGTRLRLRGKGRVGRDGERGDAFLAVDVAGAG
jgi:DnaJ-class molecular chaperone